MVTYTLYFDALIIELSKICLVMDQAPGEGTVSKVSFDLSGGEVGSFFGQVSRLVKKFSIYWG